MQRSPAHHCQSNPYSKFSKPGLEVYTGSDVVNGHTAQEWGEKYKPYFIYDVDIPDYGCDTGDTTSHPAKYYYRVVKGYDPYMEKNSIAIQYFVYWDTQPCPPHNYDYEHFWVWIDSWGSQPYRVVFSDWDSYDDIGLFFHMVSVFRTEYKLEKGNGIMPVSESTGSKAWYPFGKELFSHKARLEMVDSLEFSDTTHVWLRVPHIWHSFSPELGCGWPLDSCDADEEWYCPNGTLEPGGTTSYCAGGDYDVTPSPLTDDILKSWYNRYTIMNCRSWNTKLVPENLPLITDVSDPFNHPLYWGRGDCTNPPNPLVKITSLTHSFSGNNLIATATVLDENSNSIQGLWPDRFRGNLDSIPLTLLSRTETSQGTYELTFDISGKSTGTHTFQLYAYDNLDKYYFVTTTINIPGDTSPPIISTPSDVPDPVCKIGTGSPDQLTISSTIYDTSTGNSDIVSATLHYNQPGSSWTSAAMAGSFGSPTVTATWSGAVSGAGTFYYYITAQDSASNIATNNNNGNYYTVTVNDCSSTPGDSQPPIISTPSESADPICKSGTGSPDQLTISATISDVSTGGSDVASATMYHKTPGSSSWAFGAMDGSFNSPTVTATKSGPLSIPGIHKYYITAKDAADNLATSSEYTVTVNDCSSSSPGLIDNFQNESGITQIFKYSQFKPL